MFIVPRKAITILPDWGGDATLGMRASGSNSVAIKETFVPGPPRDPGRCRAVVGDRHLGRARTARGCTATPCTSRA